MSIHTRLPTAGLVGLVVAGIVGCGAAATPKADTPSSPADAPQNTACTDAPFTSQQFAGDWTESDSPAVTTLGADGTLKSAHDGTVESGTWSYTPWESTPARDDMPQEAAGTCVLWLRWTGEPPSDLVYVPLKVTADSLELSYVGRGNTLVWIRPAG